MKFVGRFANAAVKAAAALSPVAFFCDLAGPTNDPTADTSAADVNAQVEAMRRAMKPRLCFMWQPLVRGPDQIAQPNH
jgi:hypothetical protein